MGVGLCGGLGIVAAETASLECATVTHDRISTPIRRLAWKG
jgi:hypothetical protein